MNDEMEFDINVHIRWMIRRDMEEVLNIEQASFEFPWLCLLYTSPSPRDS